jgi:hypothetical protein
MANICYTCGWCKTPTASAILTYQFTTEAESLDGEDFELDFLNTQLVVKCGHCEKLSILEVYDVISSNDGTSERETWIANIRSEKMLKESHYRQDPPLIRPCPSGVSEGHVQRAWGDAERAFATQDLFTPAGMAYRRVIDVAIRGMTNEQKSKKPLGVRVKELCAAGAISQELVDLIDRAKAFGDEAAHGMPLREKDASIARDLCEAFLRQAFTIPHLTEQIKTAIAERENEQDEEEIPF